MIKEYFRTVEGYRNYDVSNYGNVRTWNNSCWENLKEPKTLKQRLSPRGYYVVNLIQRGEKQKTFSVHKLVLEAFIGKRPDGYHCCHRDGDKVNNHIDNLRWDTPAGNEADKILLGRDNRGERHGLAKLTEKQVLSIRLLYKNGTEAKKLSGNFGTTVYNIRSIVNRRSWKHI